MTGPPLPMNEMDMVVEQQENKQPQLIRGDHAEAHGSPVPALTQSSSDVPSASASELARGAAGIWEEAALRNNCDLRVSVKVVPQFNNFLSGIRFPLCVKDEKFMVWVSELEDARTSRLDLNVLRSDLNMASTLRYGSWVATLCSDKFEEGDPYEIEAWRHSLFRDWDFHSSALHRSGNEAEIRRGIDNLIQLAFESRKSGRQIYRVERDLLLPASPWTATADCITVMALPSDWVDALSSLPKRHVFSSEGVEMTVVNFACEFEILDSSVASRQVTVDLCSAQHQRRALGFDDGLLFGATVVGSTLSMFVSEWLEDKVVVRFTGAAFELNTFQAFLVCYVFLCKLAESVAEEVEKVFKKWNTAGGKQDLQEKNRNAADRPWRLRECPKPPNSKSNKRSRADADGGQDDLGSQEMEDLDSFERDYEMGALMPTSMENEEPALPGGDSLIEENLQAHDASAYNGNSKATQIQLENYVRGWTRQSSIDVESFRAM